MNTFVMFSAMTAVGLAFSILFAPSKKEGLAAVIIFLVVYLFALCCMIYAGVI
jgi:tryptophan-rich sensory protein